MADDKWQDPSTVLIIGNPSSEHSNFFLFLHTRNWRSVCCGVAANNPPVVAPVGALARCGEIWSPPRGASIYHSLNCVMSIGRQHRLTSKPPDNWVALSLVTPLALVDCLPSFLMIFTGTLPWETLFAPLVAIFYVLVLSHRHTNCSLVAPDGSATMRATRVQCLRPCCASMVGGSMRFIPLRVPARILLRGSLRLFWNIPCPKSTGLQCSAVGW